jgi:hypothetical protein
VSKIVFVLHSERTTSTKITTPECTLESGFDWCARALSEHAFVTWGTLHEIRPPTSACLDGWCAVDSCGVVWERSLRLQLVNDFDEICENLQICKLCFTEQAACGSCGIARVMRQTREDYHLAVCVTILVSFIFIFSSFCLPKMPVP